VGLGELINNGFTQTTTAITANNFNTISAGPRRTLVSGGAPIYLNISHAFAVSTLDSYGMLRCRRMR
jgi:hypothetical protein